MELTYDEYFKMQVFEEKRINLNHYVNTIRDRATKKRVGKILSFYNAELEAIEYKFSLIGRGDGIRLAEKYLFDKFVGKELYNVKNKRYVKILKIKKINYLGWDIARRGYSTNEILFVVDSIKYNAHYRLVYYDKDIDFTLPKGRKGRIDLRDYKYVKEGTVKSMTDKYKYYCFDMVSNIEDENKIIETLRELDDKRDIIKKEGKTILNNHFPDLF